MRARDARSGNSRDFFLLRRDLCTRGTGLPPLLAGDWVRRVDGWREDGNWVWFAGEFKLAALEVELPMLYEMVEDPRRRRYTEPAGWTRKVAAGETSRERVAWE